MGSKQKRRIARAERLAQHARNTQVKLAARVQTLEQQARSAMDERDELRRVLGVTTRIDERNPDILAFTVYFNREVLDMMTRPPGDAIHDMVERQIIKAGLRRASDGK